MRVVEVDKQMMKVEMYNYTVYTMYTVVITNTAGTVKVVDIIDNKNITTCAVPRINAAFPRCPSYIFFSKYKLFLNLVIAN